MEQKSSHKTSAVICFLRHGKSDPPKSVPDEERQLLEEGRRELRAAATIWRRLGIEPIAVFTSPRQRSIDSARIYVEALGIDVQPTVASSLSPGAEWRDFKKLLHDCPENQAVAFVAHEPDLSRAIGHLTGA